MADVRDTWQRRGWWAARRFAQARVLAVGVLALAVGAGLTTACTDDATWYGGTFGSRDAPGPSLYWIDAVVTLPPGTADELRDTLDLAAATTAPDVVGELAAALPEGELLVGDELDDAFSHEGWRTTAYLSADGDALVLAVIGE